MGAFVIALVSAALKSVGSNGPTEGLYRVAMLILVLGFYGYQHWVVEPALATITANARMIATLSETYEANREHIAGTDKRLGDVEWGVERERRRTESLTERVARLEGQRRPHNAAPPVEPPDYDFIPPQWRPR